MGRVSTYKGHTVEVERREEAFIITIDDRWQTLVRDGDEIAALETAKQFIDKNCKKGAE